MSSAKHVNAISLGFYALAIGLGSGVVTYSVEQSHDLKHAAELSTFTNKVASTATNAGKTALRWEIGRAHV